MSALLAEVQRIAIGGDAAETAHGIAATGLLDLDHFRTELRQDRGGERRGDEGRDVEHANSG